AERTKAVIIHPFDDARVIAGQGTATLELFEQVGDIDTVITPVGGGGLLSGTALAARSLRPAARVFGAEPRNVDDAWQSLKSGRIMPSTGKTSIADGLLSTLGKLTFPIIREHATGIITVGEESIVDAMRLVWERVKLVVEPSAAVAVAALLAQPDEFQGRRVGIILSGGNIDPDKLPWG
ncbi:MAG: pyridoxal-phosphate dependent enzyme, partial [Gammaproteobacteria bacterium]|nr:pyridoxal-phosphate dependent enzyme [Gammaproteobacteria bacterium]